MQNYNKQEGTEALLGAVDRLAVEEFGFGGEVAIIALLGKCLAGSIKGLGYKIVEDHIENDAKDQFERMKSGNLARLTDPLRPMQTVVLRDESISEKEINKGSVWGIMGIGFALHIAGQENKEDIKEVK